jgi:hypothetical protein
VVRAETSKRTGEARRGTGPSPHRKSEAITSGRANAQQGYAATCQDAWPKATHGGDGRVVAWRLRPYERRGASHVELGRRPGDPPRGHTRKRRRGSRDSDRPSGGPQGRPLGLGMWSTEPWAPCTGNHTAEGGRWACT